MSDFLAACHLVLKVLATGAYYLVVMSAMFVIGVGIFFLIGCAGIWLFKHFLVGCILIIFALAIYGYFVVEQQ